MKHITIARAALFLAMLHPAFSWAQLPGITVQVTGLPSTEGTVEVSLFDTSENFLVEPYLQQSGVGNEDGNYETRFSAVPEGEYAVVVVHDANGNEQLDSGTLGFGGEAYGFSNNVRPWFGRPSFEDTKFFLGDSDVVVEIDLD
jgi:uncharacterized protein (DUF2141 family)